MRHGIFLLVLFSIVISGIYAIEVGAGTPHTAYGKVFNSDSLVPANSDITFNAYITARPEEILTETSTGCSYSDGYWTVAVGNFPTAWSVGEVLRVDVTNTVNGGTGSVEVEMTDQGNDAADDLYLSGGATTYTLTMAVDPVGSGTTDPPVGDHTYSEDEVVTLTASPSPGYTFVNWSGDVTNPNSATTTVMMDGDKTVTANFTQATTYTLTMAVNLPQGGTTDPAVGDHNYQSGSVVTITAIPNEGYEFVNWDGDVADPNSASTTVTMDGNKTAKAMFRQVKHTLTMEVEPEGSGTTDPAPGYYTYPEGEVVEISATPEPGYKFVSWTGNVADTSSSTTTVTMDEDQQVTANFAELTDEYTLTVTVNPEEGGYTDPAVGNHTYIEGTVVNITANPDVGYKFVNWTGDVADPSSATTTVTMDGNKTVTANFEESTHTLEISVNPDDGGTTNPPVGLYTYGAGATIIITATASEGYRFVNWTGDVSDPTSDSTVVTLDSDKEVTANFELISNYILTMAVNPQDGGSTDPAVGEHTFPEGSDVTISAIPADGYGFVNWTGGVADPNSGTTTTTMNSDKTVTAHFQLISYTLTLTVVPTEGGTVTKNPDKTAYTYGEQVILTATPNADYKFDHWSGDMTGNVNPDTITMDNDKTVTAHFVRTAEIISIPDKPTGAENGYRAQLLKFSAAGSVSNLGHNVEFQFDWGDGNLSEWGTAPDQLLTNITRITSPNGRSGLPSAGNLVDYGSGKTTSVKLTVTGGEYDGTTHENIGAEPDSATDAYNVFNGIVSCLGTISNQNEANSPLVITFTRMNPDKRYNLVFYFNCDDYGWEEASLATISGMEAFSNESSTGTDNTGNPLFTGPHDNSTKLPAGNTSTGYIAHFTNIDPGSDGEIVLSVTFDGTPSNEYKGKYGSALMLQEIETKASNVTFTAYNDLAWGDSTQSHIFTSSGTYQIRTRARCQEHTDFVSDWSESSNSDIAGCSLIHSVDPANSGVISIDPEQADYDYGTTVILSVAANQGYDFLNWNGNDSDTSVSKSVVMLSDTTIMANFKLVSRVETYDIEKPDSYVLEQNYPNPFNSETKISFGLPKSSHVKIRIYDISGRLVRNLVDRIMESGYHQVVWNGQDNNGKLGSSGVYLCRMETSGYQKTLKLIFAK